MKVYICLLSTCLFVLGCDETPPKSYFKSKIERALRMKLSDSIEVTKAISSSAIGDYTESASLKLSKEEFCNIFNKVRPVKCDKEKAIYCHERKDGFDKIASITFYPDEGIINYFYVEE